ncbi:hypothetical protein [Variovorax paradoxus]|uniref:hypothetical protein n=1 Tax=Variovorax paradoxus TaxID=34073 RepID=UPI00278556BD|nr:hypothetical protein [Variovorax paradoxus]MDQ0586624.1 hypothetical protein [Variovorax paradoxus]
MMHAALKPLPARENQLMHALRSRSHERAHAAIPEIIGAAADTLRFDFGLDPANVGTAFAKAVDGQIEEADVQTPRVIHALTPLQSAMLQAIAPDETLTPEVSNVQQALTALQEKSLVWKEKRGVYSLEEGRTAELLRQPGLLDGCAAPQPN